MRPAAGVLGILFLSGALLAETPNNPARGRSHFNDVARFVAGLPPEKGSTVHRTLLESADWTHFSEAFDQRWQAYQKGSLDKIKSWRDTELAALDGEVKTVFYPFAGPDFVNAYSFFPHAERYVLVGLEPAGSFPELTDVGAAPTLRDYLRSLGRSLNAVMTFSFFRTNDLTSDLKTGRLDGTTHVLLLFLARTGNRVTNVRPIMLDPEGLVVLSRPIERDRALSRGIEFSFVAPGGQEKTLLYFSVNLSDSTLKTSPGFRRYLENLGPMTTYVKAATYLMHKPYFSTVREAVLAQSRLLLQDDSGIPYRAFSRDVWKVKLYGSYDRPVALFTAFYQDDLRLAYAGGNVPLTFGIGYQYRLNHSNLMLATRRRP